MTLFEICTGEVGESYVRCYAWADNSDHAKQMFAKAHPSKQLTEILMLHQSTTPPFITELSDSTFGEKVAIEDD